MIDEGKPREYDLLEVIRQASVYLTVALILTLITGLLPTGMHAESDGPEISRSIDYCGRPFGWVLSVEEWRFGRSHQEYVELDLGFFLLNLMVYTILSIVIVKYWRKRRGNTHPKTLNNTSS